MRRGAIDRVVARARRTRPVSGDRGGRRHRSPRPRRVAAPHPRARAPCAMCSSSDRRCAGAAGTSPLEPVDEALGPFVRRGRRSAGAGTDAGPVVAGLATCRRSKPTGVVLANELLDNLPFGIAEFDGERWQEIRVTPSTAFASRRCSSRWTSRRSPSRSARGTGAPFHAGHRRMAARVRAGCSTGYVVAHRLHRADRRAVAGRRRGCARTAPTVRAATPTNAGRARHHGRRRRRAARRRRAPGSPSCRMRPNRNGSPSSGSASWWTTAGGCGKSEAHLGDLEAIAGRSRVAEAAALTDPAGLGAHRVVVLRASFDRMVDTLEALLQEGRTFPPARIPQARADHRRVRLRRGRT